MGCDALLICTDAFGEAVVIKDRLNKGSDGDVEKQQDLDVVWG